MNATATHKPAGTPAHIYQLKIELDDVEPCIWRRVEVPGDIGLDELSNVIQAVMGWDGWHAHAFAIKNKRYLSGDDHGDLPEEEFVLSDLVTKTGTKFTYEYDFGDSWMHTITVEKLIKTDTPMDVVARCVDGENACPPEDCGGPYGYMALLETLSNPNSDDYEEMLDWVGENFDPHKFSCKDANAALHRLMHGDPNDDLS